MNGKGIEAAGGTEDSIEGRRLRIEGRMSIGAEEVGFQG